MPHETHTTYRITQTKHTHIQKTKKDYKYSNDLPQKLLQESLQNQKIVTENNTNDSSNIPIVSDDNNRDSRRESQLNVQVTQMLHSLQKIASELTPNDAIIVIIQLCFHFLKNKFQSVFCLPQSNKKNTRQ